MMIRYGSGEEAMKKRPKQILPIAISLLLLGLAGAAGYFIAKWAPSLFGTKPLLMAACIVAAIAVVSLFGQYLAGTSDYFLSIENPRPLDDNLDTITILGWGFARQSSRSCTADLAGQGFADVRLFATRKQVLAYLFSFGFWRPVSIAWRGNAGQHPLGDA